MTKKNKHKSSKMYQHVQKFETNLWIPMLKRNNLSGKI